MPKYRAESGEGFINVHDRRRDSAEAPVSGHPREAEKLSATKSWMPTRLS